MADKARPRSEDEIARRWQVLAERRRNHLLELYRTGRWRRYYSEDQLMAEMRDAVREIRGWSAIGGRNDGAPADSPETPTGAALNVGEPKPPSS